jgi:hypothetical protein
MKYITKIATITANGSKIAELTAIASSRFEAYRAVVRMRRIGPESIYMMPISTSGSIRNRLSRHFGNIKPIETDVHGEGAAQALYDIIKKEEES